MVERRVRGVRSLASTSSKGFIHSFSIGSSAWVCRTGITLSFRSERRVLCQSPVCHSIVNSKPQQANQQRQICGRSIPNCEGGRKSESSPKSCDNCVTH